MGNSSTVFTAISSGMPESVAVATFGRVAIRALIVSVGRQRVFGEQGPGADIVATLRVLQSDATAANVRTADMELGAIVAVTRTGIGETVAKNYRLSAARTTGDVIAYGIEDVTQ